ncbi:DUF3221 domain-containing protein [Mobilitalea sibirica]|uniref:DUF3221 domain-containing protein n=1 Tax=Mobilitalea sibirica TaxID=1462919 RepID=A0A8J7HB85_9FIRM|nr:DUF3221 domain-containing protein [Mobilitalea sibirica]MBH1940811.1 DUF3221 domain-containing protein [Mobilitalea sibirica]
MKKLIYLLLGLFIIVGISTGCSKKELSEGKDSKISFEATIIEAGEKSLLVTPDSESNEYKSSDKISISLSDMEITDKKGNNIETAKLKVLDRIKIYYGGEIMESYPAQIRATSIERIGVNVLLDGYLALIDDIYNIDTGLNHDITTIAFDTTQWSNISQTEKELMFTLVQEEYGMEVIEGTFEELAEEGIIDKENLNFEKGILIKISNIEYNEKKKTITCAIEKWRSGLGAIGAEDVKAKYDDGDWDITKQGNWIS